MTGERGKNMTKKEFTSKLSGVFMQCQIDYLYKMEEIYNVLLLLCTEDMLTINRLLPDLDMDQKQYDLLVDRVSDEW